MKTKKIKLSKYYERLEAARLERVRSGTKSALDYHSYSFWKKSYASYKSWLKKNGLSNPFVSGGNRFTLRNYISTYLQYQRDAEMDARERNLKKPVDTMKLMKYYTKYSTDYKTSLAEYKMHKDIMSDYEEEVRRFGEEGLSGPQLPPPEKLTLTKIKSMTTREFAELHREYIVKRYYELKDSGVTGKEAKATISNELFGSP